VTDVVPSKNPPSNPEPEEPKTTSSESEQAESEPRLLEGVSTARTRRSASPRRKRSFWKELPILIVTALVLTILIQTFLARVYVIPSESMEMTLIGCGRLHRRPGARRQAELRLHHRAGGRRDRVQGAGQLDKSEFQSQQSDNRS